MTVMVAVYSLIWQIEKPWFIKVAIIRVSLLPIESTFNHVCFLLLKAFLTVGLKTLIRNINLWMCAFSCWIVCFWQLLCQPTGLTSSKTANVLSVHHDVSRHCAVVLKVVVKAVLLLTPTLANPIRILPAFANRLSRNHLQNLWRKSFVIYWDKKN